MPPRHVAQQGLPQRSPGLVEAVREGLRQEDTGYEPRRHRRAHARHHHHLRTAGAQTRHDEQCHRVLLVYGREDPHGSNEHKAGTGARGALRPRGEQQSQYR